MSDEDLAYEMRKAYKEFQQYQKSLEMLGWKVTIRTKDKELVISREMKL